MEKHWIIYDTNNVFSKILRKELPADIVFENERVLAFKNIRPVMPIHILIVPKKELISFTDLIDSQSKEEIGQFFKDIKAVADFLGLKGYKINFNVMPEGGQEIPHLHAHLLAG